MNNKEVRTCRNCCHYPNCPEWNNNIICGEHMTDKEAGLEDED